MSLIASSHHRRRRRRRHPVSARPRSRCARPVADTDDYLQQPDCDRLAAASRVLDVVVVVVGERPRAPPVAARGSVAVRALINSSPYIGRGGERTGRQGRDRAVSDSAQITRRQRLGGAVLETTDWAPVPVESGKARRDVDDADLSSAGSTRCRYSRPVDAGELRNADDVARCRRRPYLVPPRHVGRAANSTNR